MNQEQILGKNMNKVIIPVVLGFLSIFFNLYTIAQNSSSIKYVDARKLNVMGQPVPFPEKPFARMDAVAYNITNRSVATKCAQSAGMMVLFTTDSKTIKARWRTSDLSVPGTNTGANCQKGLDLYIRGNGKWIFAGVGAPDMGGSCENHESVLVTGMREGIKECLLYLPLFDRVDSLEIGVDEGSFITAMGNPFRHRIVIHGSSITHGSAASRAGMSYVARFGRDNDLYCMNMGFSGQCKLQKEFAHYLADALADAFIFDAFSNPSPDDIRTRFDEFVDIIRVSHPKTPLIFIQTIRRDKRNFNLLTDAYEAEKQKIAKEMVTRRMKQDKNIYFIDSDGFLGDDGIATADGTHPTDVGFSRMLEAMTPKLKRILRKYGIK
jgi:hypothetical protein